MAIVDRLATPGMSPDINLHGAIVRTDATLHAPLSVRHHLGYRECLLPRSKRLALRNGASRTRGSGWLNRLDGCLGKQIFHWAGNDPLLHASLDNHVGWSDLTRASQCLQLGKREWPHRLLIASIVPLGRRRWRCCRGQRFATRRATITL